MSFLYEPKLILFIFLCVLSILELKTIVNQNIRNLMKEMKLYQ